LKIGGTFPGPFFFGKKKKKKRGEKKKEGRLKQRRESPLFVGRSGCGEFPFGGAAHFGGAGEGKSRRDFGVSCKGARAGFSRRQRECGPAVGHGKQEKFHLRVGRVFQDFRIFQIGGQSAKKKIIKNVGGSGTDCGPRPCFKQVWGGRKTGFDKVKK